MADATETMKLATRDDALFGLAEVYANERKCPQCGSVENPPVYTMGIERDGQLQCGDCGHLFDA